MLHDIVRVNRLKLVPEAAHQRRGHLTAAFLDPVLRQVQAIPVPTQNHQGLE